MHSLKIPGAHGCTHFIYMVMVPHGCTHLRYLVPHGCTHLRYLVHGKLYSLKIKIPGTQIQMYSLEKLKYLVRRCTHYGSDYT